MTAQSGASPWRCSTYLKIGLHIAEDTLPHLSSYVQAQINMADPLFELLAPYFEDTPSPRPVPIAYDSTTSRYLKRLTTLPLESLYTAEPQRLAQSSHSTLLALQAISTKSSKSITSSADHLKNLGTAIPKLAKDVNELRDGISSLDKEAVSFSEKYSRSGENEVLDRRKRALLMARNVDRLSDILDLPTLLSSAINASTAQGASGNTNYASALDLHSHIKRLHLLYKDSQLVQSIYSQAEEAMRLMTANLITTLRGQNLKLAAAIRTIGWLRRTAPELTDGPKGHSSSSSEGSLGALFLVCRLSNLRSMLEALEPLRELADQESQRRLAGNGQVTNGNAWSGGQQTERYLKRYIEIFREQSFAIISMFKSIFPAHDSATAEDLGMQFKSLNLKSVLPEQAKAIEDPYLAIPTALATFPSYLVGMLTDTLKQYLPNVRDKASRESLLTQVLYCANSLGRLGADFSMMLALLNDDDDDDEEWITVMKKHRVLAGRLEQLASGSGSGSGSSKSASVDAVSKLKSLRSSKPGIEN